MIHTREKVRTPLGATGRSENSFEISIMSLDSLVKASILIKVSQGFGIHRGGQETY